VLVGKRIYDVQCEDGSALELQNRIDEKIIQEREAKTPNMVWLFNFTESKDRVQFMDKKAERFWIRRLPPALRCCESPVYLDLGEYTRPAVEVVEDYLALRPQQRRILRVDAMPEKIANDQFNYWESKETNDWSQFRSMIADNAGYCVVMTIPQFFQEVGLMSRVRPIPDFSGKRNTSDWKVWPCNLPATWERKHICSVDHLSAYLRADYQLHFLPKDAQGEYEVSSEFKDLQLANIYADRGAGFIKMPVFKQGQQTGEWVVGFWNSSLGANCPSNQVKWVNEYLTLSEADAKILAFCKSGGE
jgi:hypothetical protein